MRLIDGEVLEQILQNAITLQKEMAKNFDIEDDPEVQMEIKAYTDILQGIKEQPTIEPEPLSDAYMKAVWTWLLDYQIKAAELEGRYTPYEVLSWVANDWRKEHEGSD